MKSQLLSLYQRHFGHRPRAIVDLRADGSNRSLYRLIDMDGSSVVGVHGPDPEENQAFISFSRAFRSIGLPVPEIHMFDEEQGIYLEEDLGDVTLFDRLTAARVGDEFPVELLPLYRKVVELLPRVQVEGGKVIDFSIAYPCSEFDRQSMVWDLNYFKYHFLKLAHIPFNEARLEADFSRLCDYLLQADRSHFLYRDFQSRNIMLRDGSPWLIDYQGGRRGALQYDLASLLYDAKAAIPDPLRDELLNDYLGALSAYQEVDRDRFIELYRGFVLIRIMQAMGAYGYRGFFERKAHFLASVPYAIRNIETLLERGLPIQLPELWRVLERIAESGMQGDAAQLHEIVSSGESGEKSAAIPATNGRESGTAEGSEPAREPLTVGITSFSFKRGYPEGNPEHGGGFVFDCRALHNPGRYEEYKTLCGLDTPVVEFLEREEGVATFWENVKGLVEVAVRNYLERGFTYLSVSFGCTGGQHRSVYFAERLGQYLRETFPEVEIRIKHREQERRERMKYEC